MFSRCRLGRRPSVPLTRRDDRRRGPRWSGHLNRLFPGAVSSRRKSGMTSPPNNAEVAEASNCGSPASYTSTWGQRSEVTGR